MKHARLWSLILGLAVVLSSVHAAESFKASFTKDGWNAEDFIRVKSPRWAYFGEWVQEADCIRNAVPEGATEQEMQGKRAGETYTSMVYNRKVKGNMTVSATMAFDYRMAPLIVLAPELGADAEGRPEYREHYEIVLYDLGVNVWRHFHKDGKPSWEKAAYARFPLHKRTQYAFTVKRAGNTLHLSVDGHDSGVLLKDLPDDLYVGVTACEGVNRFYDFSISQ